MQNTSSNCSGAAIWKCSYKKVIWKYAGNMQHTLLNFKMAEQNTTLNEEKLTQLIRKIFQEEFIKQEVHITNIISSNFKVTIEEIKKSQEQIKELKKEVTDLKSGIEHTDADLNDLSDRVDEIYD